jgi:hypothetical protein
VLASPFLFTAGRILDYQFVILPARFREGKLAEAFHATITSLLGRPTKSPEIVIPDNPLIHDIAIVYSCGLATINGTVARDSFHRDVRMIWGLVFNRSESLTPDFRSRAFKLFSDETPRVLSEFERFWNSTKSVEPTVIESAGGSVALTMKDGFADRPQPIKPDFPITKVLWTSVLVILLMSMSLNGYLLWSSGRAKTEKTNIEKMANDLKYKNEGLRRENEKLKQENDKVKRDNEQIKSENEQLQKRPSSP